MQLKRDEYLFGQKHFAKWGGCKTYGLGPVQGSLSGLLDHGFIAERACVWGGFEGHELAIVSRTYVSDDSIDNPPDGLRCVRLPAEVMGTGDMGTPIATMIISHTPVADSLLSLGVWDLPAHMLPYLLPLDMIYEGYTVTLTPVLGSCYPLAKITWNEL